MIETERLILRAHRLADFDAHAAMWADPEVVRYISGKPSTREESWGRMMRYPGMWALVGYGFWLFEEKATGAFVGEGGFGAFKREIDPPLDAPEQGWALTRDAQGKGYGFEAMSAALAWAERHFARSDFVCTIASDNAPSLKLAARLGYCEYARAPYKGEETILLRRA